MDIVETIRVFRRVAQRGSFSEVAAEFKVTQPTISKVVARLESALGVTLFRRSTRGLSLTSEGQKLFHSSAAVIEQLDALLASVKSERLLLQGQLRVTASLAFARLILAPLFVEFSEAHPKLKFHFQLSDGYVDLVENNIDLAVRIGELPDSSLRALKVGQSKRSFYASLAYLKKNGAPRDLQSLHSHRLLFYNRVSDRPAWPVMGENGKMMKFRFEPYLQSDGSDLIRELVINGVGIALLPSWMMLGLEDFKVKPLAAFEGPPSPIYVVSAGNQEMSSKQKVFSKYLREKLDQIATLSLGER